MRMQRIGPDQCRPLGYLHAIEQRYPRAWDWAEQMRLRRGKDIPGWPDWCYLPIAGTNSIVENDSGMSLDELKAHAPERLDDSAALAALGAWRLTQGIYRFDATLYEALIKSKISGDVPHEVLYRLPQWCVYLETPGMLLGSTVPMYGAFVHLDYAFPLGRPRLQILLDLDRGGGSTLVGFPLPLGDWPLAKSLELMVGRSDTRGQGYSIPEGLSELLHPVLEPILSLLLYICTEAGEAGDGPVRPAACAPSSTGQAPQPVQAQQPRIWDVGAQLGAALRRAAQAQHAEPAQGAGRSPKPHVRLAHWHGFRQGPRKHPGGSPIPVAEQELIVRWLPPIPVRVRDVGAPSASLGHVP